MSATNRWNDCGTNKYKQPMPDTLLLDRDIIVPISVISDY